MDAGVDLFIIRGSTVSAEHVSSRREPLNLKRFIYELDVPVIVGGVCTDTAALHLMRTGAAGVLVGFGGGAAHSTRQSLGVHAPMATAIADVAAARRDYLDESGGRYVHVIADGGIGRSGDLARAIACGADAVMLGAAIARAEEAPGRGWHWGSEATHPDMPRGQRVHVGTTGTLEQILYGPSTWVPSSGRWPRRDTRRSRTSSAPRWSSPRTRRPDSRSLSLTRPGWLHPHGCTLARLRLVFSGIFSIASARMCVSLHLS